MSSLFNTSLDQLIKGDLDIMKEKIQKVDIKIFDYYGKIYTFLLFATIIALAPLVYYFKIYGMMIELLLFIITFIYALKIEKFKKKNNIQTYKEIVAFSNGERLDEITQNQEIGKRPYQKFLLAFTAGLTTLVITMLLFKLLAIIN